MKTQSKIGLHFSSMQRLLDMIVIQNESEKKRCIAYGKKLVDNLISEGYEADAKVMQSRIDMWEGKPVAMATMD